MTTTPSKKIDLQLVGLNGNAFHLLGAFAAQARREGWTKEEINAVLNKAMAGNYDHLVYTLDSHCAPTSEPPPDRLDDDDDPSDDRDE